jgi:putative endonuclease
MPRSTTRTYFVYLLSSARGVLYVGVTNDLRRRLAEHLQGTIEGFTSRYGIHHLVYFEKAGDIHSALEREKQIKGWRREKKLALIREANPRFVDLAAQLGLSGGGTPQQQS